MIDGLRRRTNKQDRRKPSFSSRCTSKDTRASTQFSSRVPSEVYDLIAALPSLLSSRGFRAASAQPTDPRVMGSSPLLAEKISRRRLRSEKGTCRSSRRCLPTGVRLLLFVFRFSFSFFVFCFQEHESQVQIGPKTHFFPPKRIELSSIYKKQIDSIRFRSVLR